jgi:succinate dehydrogenase / fumarate reductase, cytochrome b subunit
MRCGFDASSHTKKGQAASMADTGNRPLSPHLQVYTWGPHMLVSILHRATGDGLAIVGTMLLLWWLGAAASGAAAYASFIGIVWQQPDAAMLSWQNWIGRIVLVGLTWAFFQHAASGIRHLLLDTGAGYELGANRLWSMVVAAIPALLTAALWVYILMGSI